MTEPTADAGADQARPHPADAVADAVVAVEGVGGLHAGSFGEVGTLLPGRRVAGVRVVDSGAEVHITVEMGHRITDVADAVVAAVEPLVGTPVQVVVEDVVPRHGGR